jgi:hypothetical protein
MLSFCVTSAPRSASGFYSEQMWKQAGRSLNFAAKKLVSVPSVPGACARLYEMNRCHLLSPITLSSWKLSCTNCRFRVPHSSKTYSSVPQM